MDSLASVRDLSRALFGGAQYRIEVGAELHSNTVFTALDLLQLLGDPPGRTSIHTELKRLRESGLVLSIDKPRSDRSRPLIPVETSLWDTCRELRDRAIASSERAGRIQTALQQAALQDPGLASLIERESIDMSDPLRSIRTSVLKERR